MQVNYAKVADLAKLIKTANAKDSMLSQRGSLSIDERTNTLLVQDTSDKLADIRRLVQTLDVPVRQVLIEARIVIVSDTFERDLGARFGVTSAQSSGTSGLLAITGNGVGADTITQSAITNLQNGTGKFPVTTPAPSDNRYQVNLPAANTNGSIGVSLLGGSYLVDLELSAAQNEGKSETISSPRVITANQKQATIMQGVEIPYQESASSGATTTQFKNAVLSLEGHPVDHAGQPCDPGSGRLRRFRRSAGHQCDRRQRAVDRHPPDHYAGARQRRANRGAGRHSRYDQNQASQQGAVPGRDPDFGKSVQEHHRHQQQD